MLLMKSSAGRKQINLQKAAKYDVVLKIFLLPGLHALPLDALVLCPLDAKLTKVQSRVLGLCVCQI